MGLKSALKKLEESAQFKQWSKKNPDTFFSYALKMLEENKNNVWQLGFYHKKTDKITTFIVDETEIKMQPEEEIFKKPSMEVRPIDIEKIKTPFETIAKKAEKFQKNKYPNESVSKTIAILQNLEGYGNIWNVTCVTHSFKTLNMKINAKNGKIMHHSLQSLMSFIKK